MRGLPVRRQPLWLTDFRQRVSVSLWFVPTIFALLAIGAANLCIWLDSRIDASVQVRFDLVSDPGTAANFAGTIAAAMLAFIAVVFATTLVAIQLAASQYSPRTVRVFIRTRVTRVTLGLFLANFVFALVVVISNRSAVTSAKPFAPVVSVSVLLILTLATVFGFVAYLHGVVRLMRVQYLLETIATESRSAIDANFPPLSAYVDTEVPNPDPAPLTLAHPGPSGVVTASDLYGLVELCRDNDCWLDLTIGVGEYLAHGSPIAVVHGAHSLARRWPNSSSCVENEPSSKILHLASDSWSTSPLELSRLQSTIRPRRFRPSTVSVIFSSSPVADPTLPVCVSTPTA